MVYHPRATINLPAKYEVSNSNSMRYRIMKGDKKFETWDALG